MTTHPNEWQEYEEFKDKRNKTSKEHIPAFIEQHTESYTINDSEKKEITSPYGPITTVFEGNIQPIPITAQSVRKPGGKRGIRSGTISRKILLMFLLHLV